jgi:hypothetical protein
MNKGEENLQDQHMDLNMIFHPDDHLNVVSDSFPLLGSKGILMMEEQEEEPQGRYILYKKKSLWICPLAQATEWFLIIS